MACKFGYGWGKESQATTLVLASTRGAAALTQHVRNETQEGLTSRPMSSRCTRRNKLRGCISLAFLRNTPGRSPSLAFISLSTNSRSPTRLQLYYDISSPMMSMIHLSFVCYSFYSVVCFHQMPTLHSLSLHGHGQGKGGRALKWERKGAAAGTDAVHPHQATSIRPKVRSKLIVASQCNAVNSTMKTSFVIFSKPSSQWMASYSNNVPCCTSMYMPSFPTISRLVASPRYLHSPKELLAMPIPDLLYCILYKVLHSGGQEDCSGAASRSTVRPNSAFSPREQTFQAVAALARFIRSFGHLLISVGSRSRSTWLRCGEWPDSQILWRTGD